MNLEPQLIAPFQTGLIESIEPWMAPSDALIDVDNFHVHNGYLEKRQGYSLLGYMVYETASSETSGDYQSGFEVLTITQANPGVVTTNGVHDIQNGDQVLLTNVSSMGEVNNQRYTAANVGATTLEIGDTSSFEASGTGGRVAVSPGNPITGIFKHLSGADDFDTYIFDTERINRYDEDQKVFVDVDHDVQYMDGTASDFVWTTEWFTPQVDNVNIIYFTNGIPYRHDSTGTYDASTHNGIITINGTDVQHFNPQIGVTGQPTRRLIGGKLLFVFGDRLLVLNTFEDNGAALNAVNYPQRCRYSQVSNPSVNNWREDVGAGGFLDAPTGDHIISARTLKDSIIVFFTNSVWSLRFIPGIPGAPFRWVKLNNFRACDGKMASVGYDQGVISMGKRGIHITDYSITQRIDGKIENFVTEDVNAEDFDTVFCARSYGNERWWTLYPKQAVSNDDRNQGALIYDDNSKAFTKYDISFNSLGYGNFEFDFGCDEFVAQNGLDYTCQQVGDETCASPLWQFKAESFIAGDFTGGIFQLEYGGSDVGNSIEGYFKSTNWAPFKEEGIESQMSYIDIYADSSFDTVGEVEAFKDNDGDPYWSQQIDFLPDLGYRSTIASITQANPAVVTSVGHNLTTGDVIYMYLVTGMVEVNDRAFTVTVVDNNSFSLDSINSTSYGEYTGEGIVVDSEFYKTKVWKRVYAGGIGYEHAISIFVTGLNKSLRIHALKPYFKRRGRRTVN